MKMTMMFFMTGKSSVAWIMRNVTCLWSHLVTSGVSTMNELCESHVGTLSVEEEDSEPEPEVVLNFAEVLTKVKSFVWVHSNSNDGCDTVLGLESLFFELRRKVCTKQLPITEFSLHRS
jgi:hypothetical protein